MRCLLLFGVIGALLAALSACDSAGSSTPSTAPGVSGSSSEPATNATTLGRTADTTARLTVDRWGATPDGLLSVVVTNNGPATVQSARTIIVAKDKFGNTVATGTTTVGPRCCTIVNLSAHQSYGLYSDIGTRVSRVASVSMLYSDVRTVRQQLPNPVSALHNVTMLTSAHGATVSVDVTMAATAGPYMTAQALVDGPDGKLVGVISGAFYCLHANAKRTITLQFFHAVPEGSSVAKVVTFALDKQTALSEKAKTCSS